MLAPAVFRVVALMPPPIIRMNVKPEFGAIVVADLDVPAIAVVVADDLGRCGGCTQGQRARGGAEDFVQSVHKHFSVVDRAVRTLCREIGFLTDL